MEDNSKVNEVTNLDVMNFLNHGNTNRPKVTVHDVFKEIEPASDDIYTDEIVLSYPSLTIPASHNRNIIDDGIDHKEGLFFSKMLAVVTLVLYFILASFVLYLSMQCLDLAAKGITANLTSFSASLAAMISVPIALPCTCIVSYLKKTQAGHTGKVLGEVYSNAADKELECKLVLMQKQHDLKLTDMEMNKSNITRIDNITNAAFNDMNSAVKTTMNDAVALDKKESA